MNTLPPIIAILCLYIITLIYCLTCEDILNAGDEKTFKLADLQATQPKDIVECLAHLGKERMPMEEAEYIWKAVVGMYEATANVPESVLMLLHWVTPALQPEDYGNITLSNIDVIQNFGLNYNLSRVQLAAIAERVREDFAGKEPEDYTYYDLVALRQILCAFNRTEIERIHPSAYREAATVLGKLDRCPSEVLQGFGTLAVQPSAFGNPAKWTDATVEALGVVANYLPRQLIMEQTN